MATIYSTRASLVVTAAALVPILVRYLITVLCSDLRQVRMGTHSKVDPREMKSK